MGDKRWTVSHREIERLTARPHESKVIKSIVVVVLVFLLFSFILKVMIFLHPYQRRGEGMAFVIMSKSRCCLQNKQHKNITKL